MTLAPVDFAIIGLYMVISLALGLWFTRRGTASVVEYFVAGRQLTWWLAGTSIVATSYAADTPLAVARIVRTSGLQGNWYWWSGVMGFVACMFFFAPLWRRSRLLTDVELIELRYAGRPAAWLRVLLALYKSVLENGIIMGWVLLGMQKIAAVCFAWPKESTILALVVTALAYTLCSGLWGVVVTDLFQFALAMIASICLAAIVLVAVGGPAGLADSVHASAVAAQSAELPSPVAPPEQIMSLAPDLSAGGLALLTFGFYLLIQWWGGVEGGGFLVQRLFATKDERHAMLALLWFTVAHFGLRCWPWIVVGLASVVYLPELVDPETAYPMMMVRFLPVGMKGVMVASLLAAFMSTISTHLNWGASYLLNDVYRPLLRPRRSETHYVRVAQGFVLAMALLAGLAAWQMESIFGAWLYLTELAAGAVVVGVARWYWWRVNAWSQISALVSSLVVSNALRLMGGVVQVLERLGWSALARLAANLEFLAAEAWYPLRFAITLVLSTLIWVAVTLLTRPVPLDHLQGFYRRVRPGGWWGPVARSCPDVRQFRPGWAEIAGWAVGVVTVYLCVFGIGWLLLGAYLDGALAAVGVACGGWFVLRIIRRRDRGADAGMDE